MISSQEERLQFMQKMGITPVDRRLFSALDFDEEKYRSDSAYKRRYQEAEKVLLSLVQGHTNRQGASIFIENIGIPVFRATVKALARQGVLTTSVWKSELNLLFIRDIECINPHVHNNTHYSRYS